MSTTVHRSARRPLTLATRLLIAVLSAALSTTSAAAQTPAASPAVPATTPARAVSPDLQGIWDFNMRAGDRTSPGFFALGPVDQAWGGSITMYLTNTLAIRTLTIDGDSVRMVVASREGDVVFRARLSSDARTMEGIVHYHGGALLPMTATRRAQPVAPR